MLIEISKFLFLALHFIVVPNFKRNHSIKKSRCYEINKTYSIVETNKNNLF